MMKKTFKILSVLLIGAFFSCEKDSGENIAGGSDSEIRFPSGTEYETGDDVFIICSGISAKASFYLTDAGGNRTLIDDVTITASGIFFTLDVPSGEYAVTVEQDGTSTELGRITVTAATISIIVNEVPDWCIPGGILTVTGADFDPSAELVLMDAANIRYTLDTDATESTLSAEVPETSPRGKLSLLIVQDNGEMTVSETFFVTTQKRLVRFVSSTGSGESAYTREFSFIRDESGNVTSTVPYTLTISQGNDATDGEYTSYDFAASETDEENGYYSFALKIGDGKVLSSAFESGDTDPEPQEYEWDYDASGFLTWYVGRYTYELTNSGGNINPNDLYVYEDDSLVNNPFAVDCTLGLQAATDADHVMVMALALGSTGEKSANLPTATYASSSTAETVTYTFDDEGYVTGASYGSIFPISVEFTYE